MRLNLGHLGVGILLLAQGFGQSPIMRGDAGPEPPGGLIAFALRAQAGRLQIFTENLDGSNLRQVTFEGDNGRPDWSPDGRRIAFGSRANGKTWVAVMDADGSNQRFLVEGTGDPDWSPDGNQIAFSRPGVAVDGRIWPQIWLMNPDGSNLRQITRSSTLKGGPSWSPDGTQMVFILIKNPGSPTDPQPTIGIMNADGTNQRILTTEDRVNVRHEPDGAITVLETAHDANAPAWSPVDNRIAFWSGIENRYGQIWVINSDGTGSTQLTEDPTHGNDDDPSWSPDGKRILFATGRSGRNELWVMDAAGSNERKVSDNDAAPFPGRASWQPVRPLSIASVLNAASFRPGIVDGSWISITGSNLSTTTRLWRSDEIVDGKLPTSLDSVSVTVEGLPAAVEYISPTQLNVQAPVTGKAGSVNVVVSNSLGVSAPTSATVSRNLPGLFVFSPMNGKYAAAVIARSDGGVDYAGPESLFGSALTTRPVIPGEILELYATGLGPTNPFVPAGQVFAGAAALMDPVTVTIGGQPAAVGFAGLAGAGLYQLKVTVPAVPWGDHAIVVTVKGVASQPGVYVAVGAAPAQ